ncbi:hypothetical protein GGQ22_08400 [Nocardioides sp. zg-579]|uniref:Sulfotransferase family protein n=1 Tax=Nocardioides marmotae TaxID=2663857 RepID=A0A6I3J0S9_9ACTN|nr:hypothetical protein [Nocardioides marmotae]MCR6031468.1 hypothetical protein [Gordonia jinghuaiqii]MTB95107.1 hypothetical protein [Nocardioides marmotae]QKE02404.1 hypothetical protein HPC71_16005 [Nocardioides marmotae]
MRVVLHVGLPKTGTTYLQSLLASQREALRAGGVLHPFVRPGAMFRSAVELRGSHAKFGLAEDDVAGTWAAVCERARQHDGPVLLGHEVLAGATPAQVAATLAPLEGVEVDVVVTARDLGRQATAHWQEEVKLGDTRSFADVEAEELRADTGRDAGPDAGGRRPHFWHAQDWGWALERWSTAVPAERVHLVVCPAPGAEPAELWRRFAAAARIDPGLLDAGAVPAANPSLGRPEVALLRAVNAELAGRLDREAYLRVVKKEYAEGVLAAGSAGAAGAAGSAGAAGAAGSAGSAGSGSAADRPRTPDRLRGLLESVTDRWLAELAAGAHPVHGDPAELRPVVGAPGDPDPDVPLPADADPAAVARDLLARAGHGPRRRGLLRRRVRG